MNVKKFTAATSREALRKVRDALGPDAVILSNRPSDGVVEILALANDDAASLAAPAPAAAMAAPAADVIDMGRMQQMMAAAIAQAKDSAAVEMSGMMSEIRAMRGMMETQLAELSWGSTQQREPQKA